MKVNHSPHLDEVYEKLQQCQERQKEVFDVRGVRDLPPLPLGQKVTMLDQETSNCNRTVPRTQIIHDTDTQWKSLREFYLYGVKFCIKPLFARNYFTLCQHVCSDLRRF